VHTRVVVVVRVSECVRVVAAPRVDSTYQHHERVRAAVVRVRDVLVRCEGGKAGLQPL
jgi:hypothetical protein